MNSRVKLATALPWLAHQGLSKANGNGVRVKNKFDVEMLKGRGQDGEYLLIPQLC